MIVVDTNVVAYFLFENEQSPLAEGVREVDPFWAAPLLWRSELRNVLVGYLRHEVMSLASAKEYMSDALVLFNGREYEVESERVLDLADSSGCTAYDCEFVCLAEELRLPLVTTDKQILCAFPEIAVSMRDFSGS